MRPFIPPHIPAAGEGSELDRAVNHAEAQGYQLGYAQGETQGHARGLEEGYHAARQELEPHITGLQKDLDNLRAADSLAATLRKMLQGRARDRQVLEQDARRVVMAALKLVLPALMRTATGGEIVALLRDALHEQDNEVLRVRANAHTLAQIRAAMDAEPEALPARRIELHEDASIPAQGAQIAWARGGLSYDPAALAAQLAALLGTGDADSLASGDKSTCENPEFCENSSQQEHAA